ncbi:MAG: cbb3-type cytochrome oxidase assembly protein CcoS [Verrucomicrobia bacterium]|nr:cbb3-type cytochrome oxidase assembly protein CcoS [Verrucomicrobiota bacterium]MCH8514034.1 cbb3-type cytochrome oxidase assembly protein CcoS [Kiritimatiellia bacterium]
MSIIIMLLGISLCIALFFLVAFLWSVHGGQFDDQVTPAIRMLNDDETPASKDAQKEAPDSPKPKNPEDPTA